MFIASTAKSHFLWLKTIQHEDQPTAFLFFGESPADEAYHFPEKLAKIKLWRRTADGKRAELATESIDTDDRVGLIAPVGDEQPGLLESSQEYGIYGGGLLVYYAKSANAQSGAELNSFGPSKELKLDIVPQWKGEKLELTLLWDGKPLADATATVRYGDNEPVEGKSNSEGRFVVDGGKGSLISVLVNHTEKDKAGKFGDDEYKSVMHYSSLTFNHGKASAAEPTEESTNEPTADAETTSTDSNFPPLPTPIASFGAAVADGWLYVYGGHQGGEHEHSAENLARHFRRIRVDGSGEWEELPMQTALQGLPLVEHGGKIYRVGGLEARNATTTDDEDLHSQADFAVFDPATKEWTALEPLPIPRSSHNAVVADGKLYVVGGWHLHGEAPGDWQNDMLVLDFAKPEAGWQTLPGLPVKRRGLAVGHWRGKIVAIGGINEKGNSSQRVDLFDPHIGKWTQGPDLPDSGLAGFGGSACTVDGELYVSGLRGILHRLSETGRAWENAGQLAQPRFFHQLVPGGGDSLLAVGGASRKGHIADIERIQPDSTAAPTARTTSVASPTSERELKN
jgi:hypothetical protein